MNHNFKHLIRLFFIGILFCSCSTQKIVHVDNKLSFNSLLDKIVSNGVLRVGTTGDYKPFSYYKKESTALQGMDITMANDLANSLDVEVKFVRTSWPTLIDDLQDNKFDIAMSGISIRLNRQKFGFYSIPIVEGGKIPICRDNDAERFKSLDSINQKDVRVIFNPGGTNEEFARSNFPNATLIENEDNISIFRRIVEKEADVMVTDQIEALIQEKIHLELEAVNLEKPFAFFEKAYLMPRDVAWKSYVDQWLNLRKKQGVIDAVIQEEIKKSMSQ